MKSFRTKLIIALVLVLVMATSLITAGGQQEADSADKPIRVTFYSPNTGNFASQAVAKMAKTLEEKSGGKMVGNLIEAGTAGNQVESAQMMMNGDIQVVVYTVDQMSTMIPGAGDWISLPFLFDSDEQAASDYEEGGWMLDKIKEFAAEGGIHVYDYVYSGFKCLSFTKDVHSYDDWQNLKVRVPNNPMFHELCGAYGMQTVAGINMYTSLQNGTVDSVLQGEEGHEVFNLEEVIKELVLIHDTYGSVFYVSNENWFKGLDPSLQTILDDMVNEISYEYNVLSKNAISDYVNKTLPANNVEVVYPDREWKNAMKKAVIPVWERAFASGQYDADLMERLRKDYYEVNFADVL